MTVLTATAPQSTIQQEVNNTFIAGNLANHYDDWVNITNDPYILQAIMGYKIDFTVIPDEVPTVREYNKSTQDESILDAEITQLLLASVIVRSTPEPGQVVSPIFLRDKPDGSYRMILNLKRLNEDI